MSQPLESLFEEKPNICINIEHADGFDESSPLVPSSSFIREVEKLGFYMDSFLFLKEFSSIF